MYKFLYHILMILPAMRGCDTVAGDNTLQWLKMEPNKNQVKSLSINFANNHCYLTLHTDTSTFKIGFSSANWLTGTTRKAGPYLLAAAKARLTGLPPFKVAGHYTWVDENTLELTLRYIESPHTERIICHFDENKISIDFGSSISKSKETIKGELSK